MEPRTAIVTGASHGIGAHIARILAARAMNLLLVARSEDELRRLAAELRTPEVTVAVAAVDLAGRQAAQQVAEAARAELGHVDVLVNNAATATVAPGVRSSAASRRSSSSDRATSSRFIARAARARAMYCPMPMRGSGDDGVARFHAARSLRLPSSFVRG